jgi:hypothetical protein
LGLGPPPPPPIPQSPIPTNRKIITFNNYLHKNYYSLPKYKYFLTKFIQK